MAQCNCVRLINSALRGVEVRKMGLLNEVIGAVVAEETLSKADSDAGFLKKTMAAVAGFEGEKVIEEKLTNREAQVLERIVAGRLNKQIADDLNISIKTVEAHRANIMEKLNANTVADLLKVALGSNAPKS